MITFTLGIIFGCVAGLVGIYAMRGRLVDNGHIDDHPPGIRPPSLNGANHEKRR